MFFFTCAQSPRSPLTKTNQKNTAMSGYNSNGTHKDIHELLTDASSLTPTALDPTLEQEILAKQADEAGRGDPFSFSDDDEEEAEDKKTAATNVLQNDGYGRAILRRANAEGRANKGNDMQSILLHNASGQEEQNPTLQNNNARALGVMSAADVNRETFHEDIREMDGVHTYTNPRLAQRRYKHCTPHLKKDALNLLVGEGPFHNRSMRDPYKYGRQYEKVVKGQWGHMKKEWERKVIPVRQNRKWPIQRQSESERILADRYPEQLNAIRKPRYFDVSQSGVQQQATTMPTGWLGFMRNLPLWTTLQKPKNAILNISSTIKETTKERESRLQSERAPDARGFYPKNIKNTEFPRDKRPTDEFTSQWRLNNFAKLKSRTMRNEKNPHVAFFQAQTGTRRIRLGANPNSKEFKPESMQTMHPASVRQERYTNLNDMFTKYPHPGPLTNASYNKIPFAGEKTVGTFDNAVFQRGENWMREPILHSRTLGSADRNRAPLNESYEREIPYDKVDRHISGGNYGPMRAQVPHAATGIGIMGTSGANAGDNSSGALSTMLTGIRRAVGKIYFPLRRNTDPYDTRDNQNEKGEWNTLLGVVTAKNTNRIAAGPEKNVQKLTRSLMLRNLREQMDEYRDPVLV